MALWLVDRAGHVRRGFDVGADIQVGVVSGIIKDVTVWANWITGGD